MQTLVNHNRSASLASTPRQSVMEVINEELYPKENFPSKNFPGIDSMLMNLFLEIIKPQQHLWELYSSGIDGSGIKNLAREILNFKNLLQNYPQSIVMIYRKYIERFIAFKHPGADDRDDITQEVITRLIGDKIFKIQKKYDFNFNPFNAEENTENLKNISSFTSYLMVTVRNIYIDIIRERNVRPLTAGGLEEIGDVPDKHGEDTMIHKIVLKEELVKLQTILILYYKTRAKLELCLKLKYRIPITQEDIEKCFPQYRQEDIKVLSQDFTFAKDKRVFEQILTVFNYHEARENKSDTLRKWINVKIEEIIMHLNRTHRNRVYNTKNFADFISLYYRDFNMANAHAFSRGEI